MSGLRTPFVAFLPLVLLPAGVLAWLGWRAADPLVESLHRALGDEVRRTLEQAVTELPLRQQEVHAAIAAGLGRAADRLAAELPETGTSASFVAVARELGGLPRIVASSGEQLLPAGPRPLRLEWLPEWPRFEQWRRLHARDAAAAVPAFAAPALLAWAIAAAEPDAARAAARLAELPPSALVDAGPLPCERLAGSDAGRRLLRSGAAAGWLFAVPATAAARLRWLELAGAEAALVAAQREAVRREGGVVGAVVPAWTAPLPGGARLEFEVAPAELVGRLRLRSSGECELAVAVAAAPTALAFTGPGLAHRSVASPWGPIDVAARHRGVADALTAAATQRLLTGVGIALSLAAVAGGVWLARRALVEERRARQLRDDFIANVSHELKTPLTGLRLHAEMLAGDLSPAERQRYGEVAQAEGARLSALVDDLLDFAALERGRRRLEPEPIDLARAARSFADAWRVRAQQDGVDLRFEVAGAAQCLADATALQRIAANLLQNAFRHGRPPRAGAPRIVVAVGPGPVLEVRDNGPGVAAADREHIFSASPRRSERGGVGIGLSISRELARRCGGDLVCGEDEARGETVFTLRLPDAPPLGDEPATGAEVLP